MTSIDWDLKNDFGIPIASGLYMIHVRAKLWDSDANAYVEKDKVIKWFGALRPIDLDNFLVIINDFKIDRYETN